MIGRMVSEARLLPVRWWAGYAVYVGAMVAVALLWYPHMLVFGSLIVIGNLLVRLAFPARPPARHRTKHPGTQHLAE